jgi:hypothetical protein
MPMPGTEAELRAIAADTMHDRRADALASLTQLRLLQDATADVVIGCVSDARPRVRGSSTRRSCGRR